MVYDHPDTLIAHTNRCLPSNPFSRNGAIFIQQLSFGEVSLQNLVPFLVASSEKMEDNETARSTDRKNTVVLPSTYKPWNVMGKALSIKHISEPVIVVDTNIILDLLAPIERDSTSFSRRLVALLRKQKICLAITDTILLEARSSLLCKF